MRRPCWSGGVDRDHLGGVPVEAAYAVVVAGELEPVIGAELMLDLGEERWFEKSGQRE